MGLVRMKIHGHMVAGSIFVAPETVFLQLKVEKGIVLVMTLKGLF
jgi:hypothetical protein